MAAKKPAQKSKSAKPAEQKPAAKAKSSPKSSLTAKEEAFCRAYVETSNGSEAYRRAYNAANMKPESIHRKAVEVKAKGRVTARIEELQAKVAERHDVTVDYIIGGLKTVAERSMQVEAVLNKDGEPIGEYQFNAAGANKSLELLGKHLGMFTEKMNLHVTTDLSEILKARGRANASDSQ